MTRHSRTNPQFYLTLPAPCPYLEGREERKIFTYLKGDHAIPLNDILTDGGFRRSQSIIYRPACDGCAACVSTRVLVDEFKPSKNCTRILKRNSDLIGEVRPCKATADQYALFRHYLDARHPNGGMADMSVYDYTIMIEDTEVDTQVIEYRRRGPDSCWTGRGVGDLLAVTLTDILGDGLSMVYSFFLPEETDRSLGTFLILDHIARAKRQGLTYLYLGYWVDGSKTMAYKARFKPQERLFAERLGPFSLTLDFNILCKVKATVTNY